MSRIVMTIAAFINKQKSLLVNKLDLNLRNKRLKCLIWEFLKYYNWSVALYGTDFLNTSETRLEFPAPGSG